MTHGLLFSIYKSRTNKINTQLHFRSNCLHTSQACICERKRKITQGAMLNVDESYKKHKSAVFVPIYIFCKSVAFLRRRNNSVRAVTALFCHHPYDLLHQYNFNRDLNNSTDGRL